MSTDFKKMLEKNLELRLQNDITCDNTVKEIIYYQQDYKYLINNNIDFILDNLKTTNLFLLRDFLDDDNSKKINEMIDQKSELDLRPMLIDYLQQSYIEDDKVLDFLYLVIKDICKNEEVTISDLKKIGHGVWSIVFKIGEKVLKIGNDRGNEQFPNNPYIVKPILRRKINLDVPIWIEVTQAVDTTKEVTSEEVYQFYKRVRDNTDLVFCDVKTENFGYLKEDNITHWKEALYNTDETLMLLPYVGTEKLKKGEVVMIDADWIFSETEEKPFFGEQVFFERRYQREIKKMKKKK